MRCTAADSPLHFFLLLGPLEATVLDSVACGHPRVFGPRDLMHLHVYCACRKARRVNACERAASRRGALPKRTEGSLGALAPAVVDPGAVCACGRSALDVVNNT